MNEGLRSRVRWLGVPDGRDDSVAQKFAMGYEGYLLHRPNSQQLEAAVSHVVDLDSGTPLSTRAPTEDLRAALFALGRRAAHGWDDEDNITNSPATQPLLDELRVRHPDGLLTIYPHQLQGYGEVPPDYELDEWLHRSLHDVVLFAALQLPVCLDSDRLAWLAITSKPELAVRDTLGWLLQSTLPAMSVSREWKHADLAVLDEAMPRVIVEGKAMYGFDALSPVSRDQYVKRVANDLAKGRALAPHAYVLATVLMTTVMSPWDGERTSSIAYVAGNRKTAKLGAAGVEEATDVMWRALSDLGQVGAVDLGTGVAFNALVNTTLFLVRARPRGDSESVFDRATSRS